MFQLRGVELRGEHFFNFIFTQDKRTNSAMGGRGEDYLLPESSQVAKVEVYHIQESSQSVLCGLRFFSSTQELLLEVGNTMEAGIEYSIVQLAPEEHIVGIAYSSTASRSDAKRHDF